MKKISTFLIAIAITCGCFAQAPQAFRYQAIARDDAGNILINNPVSLKISLVEGNEDGIAKYVETQNVKSDPFGMIDLLVGKGTRAKGNFSDINWEKP